MLLTIKVYEFMRVYDRLRLCSATPCRATRGTSSWSEGGNVCAPGRQR